MSEAATADAPAKPKSKKLLFILIGVVVLALAGAGGAFFILKKNTAHDSEEGSETAEQHSGPKTPPVFLPMDNMVVNLADPGGNRFVQLGITLQIQDSKIGEEIKVYMPTIRSSILMLISQRSADEMLQVSGKEKLSDDIIASISDVMGYAGDEAQGSEEKKKPLRAKSHPVQGVHFSSFIVQ